MGIKTVRHPPYSPDLAPCDFGLFPKLRDCRYETIEKMKEALRTVIDTLTQVDFHGAFQKLLKRYKKCIAAGGDYFEADYSFTWVLSIKVPIRKILETYLMILVYIYILSSTDKPVSFYQNSSVWLDRLDSRSRDRTRLTQMPIQVSTSQPRGN